MQVKINKRLETVASFVEENSKIIDVGCDHALLDIYVVNKYKNVTAIASDNKEGPLDGAKENVKKYNLEDKIKLKLGNGIETIEEDVDTIIISGMGGLNMIGILKYQPYLYKQVNTIILSPNNDADKLRKEMTKLKFYIEDEELVKDKNIIYPVIIFKRGRKKYKKIEYLFGPVLLNKKETLLMEYIKNQQLQKEKLLEILPKKYWRKRIQTKKELKEINKILHYNRYKMES